jgi:hypothetical protein
MSEGLDRRPPDRYTPSSSETVLPFQMSERQATGSWQAPEAVFEN